MVELLDQTITQDEVLPNEALLNGLKGNVKAIANQFHFRIPSDSKEINVAELAKSVDDCAKSLIAIGVDRGNKVGVYDATISEWMVLFSATQKLGVELVNVGREFSSEAAAEVLNKEKCRLLFASFNAQTFLKELLAKYKNGRASDVFSEYAVMLDESETINFKNVISRKAFYNLSKYTSDAELQRVSTK